MLKQIRKSAVIGSGVMGSGIAAYLAGIGIPVYLYDQIPQELTEQEIKAGLTREDRRFRNRLSEQSIMRLNKQKPAPLFSSSDAELIVPCNLEDDLAKLGEADWIIEAVMEKMSVKQTVMELIDQHRRPGTIVSTNTSGLSVEQMLEGRSADFSAFFLGTHFFNPPRYMRLLELIPTGQTKSEVLQFMHHFGQRVLGKEIVLAKDTPNFIANRLGTFSILVTLEEMEKRKISISQVDQITGTAMGRPKSATFRTLDVVGLDTFQYVVENVYHHLNDQKEKLDFTLPNWVKEMIDKGWLGEKTGQGFYKKEKIKGETKISELDPETMTYRFGSNEASLSLAQLKREEGAAAKLKKLVYAQDQAGQVAWTVTKKTLLYAAQKLGEIADDIDCLDRAMKWGFNWELGPFQQWDAIGLEQSAARMKREGEVLPAWIEEMLLQGHTHFYKNVNGVVYYWSDGEYVPLEQPAGVIYLSQLQDKGKVIFGNAGASLVDLGDGVACLQFHSPNNAIGIDILQMIQKSIEEAATNYQGLVIGNQGRHFCVGANLMWLLMEAQDHNWFEIEQMIRLFQESMQQIRFSSVPVVAAPFSMTLGGGTEVSLPAARIQAAAETYMGLVETGVGLIPGGGGNKELLLRLMERIPERLTIDPQTIVQFAFETIAQAKVTTSAKEGLVYGYLRPQDGISIQPNQQLYDAKQAVLQLAAESYRPPQPQRLPVVGQEGKATLIMAATHLLTGGWISEHDLKIAVKLAHVLSGGDLPAGKRVDEAYLLDLEREAFLSLVGEPKTQARIQHMLLKGKPLRN